MEYVIHNDASMVREGTGGIVASGCREALMAPEAGDRPPVGRMIAAKHGGRQAQRALIAAVGVGGPASTCGPATA